jgi:hypothetical protein
MFREWQGSHCDWGGVTGRESRKKKQWASRSQAVVKFGCYSQSDRKEALGQLRREEWSLGMTRSDILIRFMNS